MNQVLAIILGGGQGSRLHPLTQLRAKPAVPIAGKYRLIDIPVSNCINSDIRKIFVLTQFNSASLNRHVNQTYQFSPFTEGFVEILAAQQTPERSDWFQGTADAVRQYLNIIKENEVTEILILSGDHLYRMDYRPFVEYHRAQKADITISVAPVSETDASDFGLFKIDSEGNALVIREKPKGDALQEMRVDTMIFGLDAKEAAETPFIASMGIYVFNRDVLVDVLTQDRLQQDFGKEILPHALGRYLVKTYLFRGYWEDIGTIAAFYRANMGLLRFKNPAFSFYNPIAPIFTRQRFLPPSKILNSEIIESMVCEGCLIESAVIRHSIIGIRSVIREKALIEDTLVMGTDFYQTPEELVRDTEAGRVPIGVGRNSIIRRAIIDKNARIGQNVQIINKNGAMEERSSSLGYRIRDGIVIIPKNCQIPDNTVI